MTKGMKNLGLRAMESKYEQDNDENADGNLPTYRSIDEGPVTSDDRLSSV